MHWVIFWGFQEVQNKNSAQNHPTFDGGRANYVATKCTAENQYNEKFREGRGQSRNWCLDDIDGFDVKFPCQQAVLIREVLYFAPKAANPSKTSQGHKKLLRCFRHRACPPTSLWPPASQMAYCSTSDRPVSGREGMPEMQVFHVRRKV